MERVFPCGRSMAMTCLTGPSFNLRRRRVSGIRRRRLPRDSSRTPEATSLAYSLHRRTVKRIREIGLPRALSPKRWHI